MPRLDQGRGPRSVPPLGTFCGIGTGEDVETRRPASSWARGQGAAEPPAEDRPPIPEARRAWRGRVCSRAPPGHEVKGPVSITWTFLQPEMGRLWGGVEWSRSRGLWLREGCGSIWGPPGPATGWGLSSTGGAAWAPGLAGEGDQGWGRGRGRGRWFSEKPSQFHSVTQFCPMDCSTLGFPVRHQLLELVQTHVH